MRGFERGYRESLYRLPVVRRLEARVQQEMNTILRRDSSHVWKREHNMRILTRCLLAENTEYTIIK